MKTKASANPRNCTDTSGVLPPAPPSEPPKPTGQAADTYNLFWPGEIDAVTGATYACTYVSIVALAGTRLVALGCCNQNPASCNGYHAVDPPPNSTRLLGAEGYPPGGACIKTSDDAGRTWTQIRQLHSEVGVGSIVWDNHTEELVVHYVERSTGAVHQVKSRDAGATWSPPLSELAVGLELRSSLHALVTCPCSTHAARIDTDSLSSILASGNRRECHARPRLFADGGTGHAPQPRAGRRLAALGGQPVSPRAATLRWPPRGLYAPRASNRRLLDGAKGA